MQSLRQYKQLFYLPFITLLWVACNTDPQDQPEPEFEFQYVLSYEFVDSISTEEISQRFGNNPLATGLINFDVTAYSITYNTSNYDGEVVEASGLVLIPDVSGSSKLTSFQHSTLGKDANPAIDQEHRAPSYLSSENAEIYLSAVLYASNGYYISAPDYIGYGSTGNMFHPYEHAQTTATTSYDMLVAAKELAAALEVKLRDDLYLLGYSQGGNSTMALHKYIEENHSDEFTITKSAMGAGAYHKSAVGEYIFNFDGELSTAISLYMWVMDTYDKIYFQRGLGYYLNEPYATEVIEGGYFLISNTNPQVVFTEAFRAEIIDPNSEFRTALADNDVHDWKAEAPIKLFHSRDDILVPYFNSVDAFEQMTARGSMDLQFDTYVFGAEIEPAGIHGAGGVKFFSDVISTYFR